MERMTDCPKTVPAKLRSARNETPFVLFLHEWRQEVFHRLRLISLHPLYSIPWPLPYLQIRVRPDTT
jgi:hypothetical protein